jgi:hypothetical protein
VKDRDRAKQLLVHYFQVAFAAAGKRWDNDYTVELEECVDALLDAAANDAAERVAQHALTVGESIAHVQEQIDTPDWRDRR